MIRDIFVIRSEHKFVQSCCEESLNMQWHSKILGFSQILEINDKNERILMIFPLKDFFSNITTDGNNLRSVYL